MNELRNPINTIEHVIIWLFDNLHVTTTRKNNPGTYVWIMKCDVVAIIMRSVNKTLSDTGIGLWHRATTDSPTSQKLMIAILSSAFVILPRKVIKLFCHKDMKVCRWQQLKTNRWTSSSNRQTNPSNTSSFTWLIYFREMQEVVWAVRLKHWSLGIQHSWQLVVDDDEVYRFFPRRQRQRRFDLASGVKRFVSAGDEHPPLSGISRGPKCDLHCLVVLDPHYAVFLRDMWYALYFLFSRIAVMYLVIRLLHSAVRAREREGELHSAVNVRCRAAGGGSQAPRAKTSNRQTWDKRVVCSSAYSSSMVVILLCVSFGTLSHDSRLIRSGVRADGVRDRDGGWTVMIGSEEMRGKLEKKIVGDDPEDWSYSPESVWLLSLWVLSNKATSASSTSNPLAIH